MNMYIPDNIINNPIIIVNMLIVGMLAVNIKKPMSINVIPDINPIFFFTFIL